MGAIANSNTISCGDRLSRVVILRVVNSEGSIAVDGVAALLAVSILVWLVLVSGSVEPDTDVLVNVKVRR